MGDKGQSGKSVNRRRKSKKRAGLGTMTVASVPANTPGGESKVKKAKEERSTSKGPGLPTAKGKKWQNM